MVDRTAYADDARTPDLALRQIFGRQRVPTALCRRVADAGLLTVETFAMLGDTITQVKQTIRTVLVDPLHLGADAPAQELALTSLAAVWKTCATMQEHFAARRAKMEEDPSKIPEIPGEDHSEFRTQFIGRHPDVVLPHHREPHRKFVERLQRDYLVHGSVNFYEVGEMRTRSETIVQKSGLSKNAEDLLKVVQVDQPSIAASETQVMDKLHSFFVALEYLNICDYSVAAGPLRYLSELEEWRHEHRGLALLLTVDSLIRKKIYRLNSDQRTKFPTFSAALPEVLTNHKQLWNDARSSAELDKFKQAAQSSEPHTPRSAQKKRSRSRSGTPPKTTAKARKNKARRQKQKELLRQARSGKDHKSGGEAPSSKTKPARDARVPPSEWTAINAFKYSGPRRCPFYNCSLGCRFGDSCKNKHLCVECGKGHPWHGNHWDPPDSHQGCLTPPPGVWSIGGVRAGKWDWRSPMGASVEWLARAAPSVELMGWSSFRRSSSGCLWTLVLGDFLRYRSADGGSESLRDPGAPSCRHWSFLWSAFSSRYWQHLFLGMAGVTRFARRPFLCSLWDTV